MPSGRPATVPRQGAILGLCWSDLDDVKLVLGLMDVYVKVVLLRGVLTAVSADLTAVARPPGLVHVVERGDYV